MKNTRVCPNPQLTDPLIPTATTLPHTPTHPLNHSSLTPSPAESRSHTSNPAQRSTYYITSSPTSKQTTSSTSSSIPQIPLSSSANLIVDLAHLPHHNNAAATEHRTEGTHPMVLRPKPKPSTRLSMLNKPSAQLTTLPASYEDVEPTCFSAANKNPRLAKKQCLMSSLHYYTMAHGPLFCINRP